MELQDDLIKYQYDFAGLCKRYQKSSLAMMALIKKNRLSFITKDRLLEDLKIPNITQTKLARKYGMTLATIRSLLNKNNIDLHIKKSDNNINIIKQEISAGMTINAIASKYNLNRSLIRNIIKENNIEYVNPFELWKKNRETIQAEMSTIIELNETKTLLDVSKERELSYEQLKRVLRDHDVPVKIHAYNKSKGQNEVEDFIKSLGVVCHSQKFDKKYEIDCFCPNENFGIEYCGEYWHSYNNINHNSLNKKRHQEKTLFFLERGINIVTIFASEWYSKKDLIKEMIRYRLKDNVERISARKTNISFISNTESRNFHEYNHINGYINSSINIGLFHDNKLLSVLSLAKSRFDKKYEYEITRYSTLRGVCVVGGFTKLLSFFIKQKKPKSILTYADLRFGHGAVYKKAGFNLIKITNPNYWYYNKNKPIGLESRMKYQKKKILVEGRTEFEKMSSLGYLKIYDCGSFKYVWRSN